MVTLAANMSYLAFGPLATLDFGNSLELTLGYDQDYRLTAIETTDGGSNWVQDLTLGYDANDRVAAIADGLDPGKSQAFAYDELWRLEQAVGAYGTIDYAYDAGGNRLNRTITDGGSTVETYNYDAFSNRLLSVDDGVNVRSFGYAADGSVISDDRGFDAFDLTYDAAGRLNGVDKNSSPEATYAYDAFGRRVFKDPAFGGTTHYQYDPDGRLLAESSAAGAPEREYIWLPLDGQAWALPIAVVTEADTASPRLHYLHADHLGTPVAMTSANLGQVEWRAVYRPFGEVHATTGTQDLALRFPGQLFDPETGFHQNWHRDYDPRLGRYMQSDPIGLDGGLNTYGYVGGDPTNLIDPQGLQEALVRSLPLAGGAAAADGPLPVGDAIALGLLGGALVYDVCTIAWDRFFSDRAKKVEEARSKGIPESELGPSGKPKIHKPSFPTKKAAKEAAAQAGSGEPVNHPAPTKGRPHYHATDSKGRKIPGTHYEY